MAIAFVQSRGVSLGVVTSGNLAFASNNAAGNFIIVAVQVGTNGRTVTVSDTNLNSYTQHKNQACGTDHEIYLVAAPNCAGGANTVTVAISGGAAGVSFVIYEYSGVATSSPLDQTASAADASGLSAHADSGNITTTTNEQLLFSVSGAAGTATWSMVGTALASANAEAASGNLSVTPPATVTDDILVLAVTTHDNVAVTLPAGWNIYQAANNTAALRATLAWKRCAGAEGAFTITHAAGDTIVANVENFRGCQELVSPINASVLTANASSSTVTAATITSTKNGCRLFFTMHDSDNGASSAQTSANLGAMSNEHFDNASTLGTDAAVSGISINQNTAGASGASTGTISLGPDVNSGGNTFLEPFFLKREEVATKISSAEVILSATGTHRGYFFVSGGAWSCLVASFKAAAPATVKQLALLGVG